MPENSKLQKLQEMMKLVNEGITREEFLSAFKEVVKIVKDVKDTNTKEWSLIHQAMQKIPDQMMSEMMSSMSKTEERMVKDCMSKCETMCVEMDEKHKAEMGKMDLEVRMLKADREAIIEDTLARVPVPEEETPEQTRDKLETLPDGEKLSIQSIQDLAKMLEEFKRVASSRSVGGLVSKRIRFVDDETPSGSGTNFTISRVPEAGSFKLYRGGARQRVTEDYTLSGKNLTLNVTLSVGEILLCDFRY